MEDPKTDQQRAETIASPEDQVQKAAVEALLAGYAALASAFARVRRSPSGVNGSKAAEAIASCLGRPVMRNLLANREVAAQVQKLSQSAEMAGYMALKTMLQAAGSHDHNDMVKLNDSAQAAASTAAAIDLVWGAEDLADGA